MSYGQKSHVALAFQTAWDVSNVDSLYHLQHLEESVALEIPQLIDESAAGIFDEGDSYEGAKMVSGDLTINAKSIPMGVLFRGIFGAPTSVVSMTMATHTFKPRTSDFSEVSAGDPITYFKYLDDGGSASLLYNLNMSVLELSVSNGEFLTAKASFVGGAFSQLVDIAAAFPAGKRFTWDASSIQLGGAANGALRSLNLKVDEAVEGMHTLGVSKFPSRVKRTGRRSIEIAGTIIFDNQDEYQKFIVQSEEELILSFAGGAEIASGYLDELIITLPAVRYTEFKPVAPGTGKIEVAFTEAVKYSVDSATSLQFDLRNLQLAY